MPKREMSRVFNPRSVAVVGDKKSNGYMLGAHTDEILTGLGYTSKEIEGLRKSGAVG